MELLVVIAIVAVITVAGSTAFKAMGGANQRQRAAVNQTVSIIDQARSQALASGEDIYLVFATGDSDFGKLRYRATSTFKLNPNTTSGAPKFVQEGPWRPLPQGIAFYTTSQSSETPGDVLRTGDEDFTFQTETGTASVRCPYLLFSSQGAVVLPAKDKISPADAELTVYLFQGIYEDTSSNPIATLKSNNKAVKDAITISRYTGRVKHLPYTDA